MKRYLKSIALLALIAALLMGCNTIPDTPDVPDVPDVPDAPDVPDVPEDIGTDTTVPRHGISVAYESTVTPYMADLSKIKELKFELHEFTYGTIGEMYPFHSALSKLPFNERFYPLNDGCWAYRYQGYSVKTANSKQLTVPITQVATIIYPDGKMPHTYKTWTLEADAPASIYASRLVFTLVLAFDNGELLTCHDLGIKFRNHVQDASLNASNEALVFGELIRDNRFSRIATWQSDMADYYQINMFAFPRQIIPAYALFDRFTRLTDYKYCELYASGDVFVGLYYDKNFIVHTDIIDETGEILHSEATSLRAKYPEEKNDYGYDGLTVMQDSKTGLYYYVNAKGEAVCEPTFTECTNIKNGTAVVKIGSVLYMLVVTSVE